MLRAKQCVKLLNSGLSGDYNPFIAKALLSKHGYKDGSELDIRNINIDFKDAE